jgi:copper resistance protein C
MSLRSLATAVAMLAALALAPDVVSAHAEPESATPAIGGTVTQLPAQVEVVFSQEVVRQGEDSSITVIDAAGTNVTTGPSEVDDANRRIIRVGLQSNLPNGVYTVQWRTISANDGDTASGSFVFTIAGPDATPTVEATRTEEATQVATEEPTPTATAEVAGSEDEDDDDEGIPAWVIVLGVVGVIAIAGVAAGSVIFVRSG